MYSGARYVQLRVENKLEYLSLCLHLWSPVLGRLPEDVTRLTPPLDRLVFIHERRNKRPSTCDYITSTLKAFLVIFLLPLSIGTHKRNGRSLGELLVTSTAETRALTTDLQ
jgi:hypothetical protein